MGCRNVPVPVVDRDARFQTELGNPPELVVDEGFQGCDIDGADGLRHIVIEFRQDGEKCRFRLARCGLGRQKKVAVGAENDLSRRHLHRRQGFPSVGVDEFPDEGGILLEYGHTKPPYEERKNKEINYVNNRLKNLAQIHSRFQNRNPPQYFLMRYHHIALHHANFVLPNV